MESAVQSVTQRADVISFGTMAEISHFQSSRVEDFKAIMTTYLQEQIKFYSEVNCKNIEFYKGMEFYTEVNFKLSSHT